MRTFTSFALGVAMLGGISVAAPVVNTAEAQTGTTRYDNPHYGHYLSVGPGVSQPNSHLRRPPSRPNYGQRARQRQMGGRYASPKYYDSRRHQYDEYMRSKLTKKKSVKKSRTSHRTERIHRGTEKVFKGTERKFKGTEKVFKNTERVYKGSERVHTGTERVKVGTQTVYKCTVAVNRATGEKIVLGGSC